MGKPTEKYSEVYDEVVAWINENGHNPNNLEITMKSTFIDDLKMKNHFFLVGIIRHLKDHFNVNHVPEAVVMKIKSVGDLVRAIATMIPQ